MALGTVTVPAVGDPATATWADQVAADLNDYVGAASAWTPLLGATGTSPSLGGAGSGAGGVYKIFGGKWLFFSLSLVWGASPTAGTGSYTVTMPVAWVNDGVNPTCAAIFGNGTGNYSFLATFSDTLHLQFPRGDGTFNLLGAAYPAAPASGNVLRVNGGYRIA